MGRRKGSKISLIILSILSAVLIYSNAGALGSTLSPVLGGLMGIIKYVIPIGIFVIGIYMMKENNDYLFYKIVEYVVFLFAIAAILHIYHFSKIPLADNVTFEELVSAAYNFGMSNQGGGAIGAIVAVPLINLLGSIGATIICIGAAIIALVLILEIKPTEMFLDYVDSREERREAWQDEREQMRERREERRNARHKRVSDVAHETVEHDKEKEKAVQGQIELMPDEIIINHFNDQEPETPKKESKGFSLFGRKKKEDPEELENIFEHTKDNNYDKSNMQV